MNRENGNKKKNDPGWAIRELVPKAVHTDRDEHLDYLYKTDINARLCQPSFSDRGEWGRPRYSSG
ncbi:MAG: hypothetical protein LWW97_11945 [Deltaproteobacteria bacterium]|nr:hypothetical protein [Deltaproteobacteria bacterium]